MDLPERMEDLIVESFKSKDAQKKERRQFDVSIALPLKVIFAYLTRNYLPPVTGTFAGVTAEHFRLDGGLTGRESLSILFAGIFERLDTGERTRMFAIRISDKTMTADLPSISIRQRVCDTLETMGAKTKPVLLLELLSQLGEPIPPFVTHSGPDLSENIFLRDLTELLSFACEENLLGSDIIRQFRSKYPRSCFASLGEKSYFARGDTRAYVQDKSFVSQITGAIIHKLMAPGDSFYFQRHGMSIINPRKGGNMVHERLLIGKAEHAQMAIGDIAGFTGSNPNSWFALSLMVLALSDCDYEHLNSPFIVTVSGLYIETTLSEVLLCYLYRTVLCDVFDESRGEYYCSIGGHLGINGNMTVTKATFALTLKDITKVISRGENKDVTQSKVKIGGDDFYAILIGKDVGAQFSYLQARIQKEVGHLKEFHREDLGLGVSENGIHALPYCKKRVEWTSTSASRGEVLVESITGAPVMLQLLEDSSNLSNREKTQRFNEFFAGVKDLSQRHPEGLDMAATLVEAFNRLHNEDGSLCLSGTKTLMMSFRSLEQRGRIYVTDKALKVLNQFENPTDSTDRYYSLKDFEKLSVLTARNVTKVTRAVAEGSYSNLSQSVYSLRGEKLATIWVDNGDWSLGVFKEESVCKIVEIVRSRWE